MPVMTTPLLCLLGYVVWTLLLLHAILLARGVEILAGRKPINGFPGGVQHGGERYWRLNRAHANVTENLPLVAILILTATLLRIDSPTLGVLAEVALAGRVVQSLAHVASGSVPAVVVRFSGFAVQHVCFAWMLVLIVLSKG